MWRGGLRRARRAMRHGLAVSGLCVVIALVAGLSGLVFSEDPPRYGVSHVQASHEGAGASSSLDAIGGLFGSSSNKASAAAALPTRTAIPLQAAALRAVEAPAAQSDTEATALDVSALTNAGPTGAGPTDEGIEAELSTAPRVASTPTAVPAAVTTPTVLQAGNRLQVTVSYYYCEQVAGAYIGDGGGFCGRMRDGNYVYAGAAACDFAHFGQRFRIEGDPTGRTYTCADTGGAVRGNHRDIWFLNNREGAEWQRVVGQVAVIEILP